MMIEIGRYVLIGLIVLVGLGAASLIGLLLYNSNEEKKAKQLIKEEPRADTLAEQIKNQFKVDDEQKERFIHTKSGISKTSVKQTRSAFSFQQGDAEKGLSLESEFDNGPESSFLPPEEKI